MIRTLLVEDERSALMLLRYKLLKHFPEEIEIVGAFDDPEEALCALPELDPDLVFLDVEMPGMNGVKFLEQVSELDFSVIFTTAYPQYAIEAIRHRAFDYLVKPIDEGDLKKAVQRFLAQKYAEKPPTAPISTDIHALAQALREASQTVVKLSVPTTDGFVVLPLRDLVRLEGSGSYTMLCTTNGQKIVASKHLSEYEAVLSVHPQFVRVHKSHIININCVQRYLRGEGGSVIMSDGSEVEVARRRKEAFLARLAG